MRAGFGSILCEKLYLFRVEHQKDLYALYAEPCQIYEMGQNLV